MPQFTYVGDDGRYYPTLGLTPEPDSVHELDEAPTDGRWCAADGQPVCEPAPAPASDDDGETADATHDDTDTPGGK